jgi:hypothetical protein
MYIAKNKVAFIAWAELVEWSSQVFSILCMETTGSSSSSVLPTSDKKSSHFPAPAPIKYVPPLPHRSRTEGILFLNFPHTALYGLITV